MRSFEQQAMVSGCERILFTAASLGRRRNQRRAPLLVRPLDRHARAWLPAGNSLEKDIEAAYVPTEPAAPVTAALMPSKAPPWWCRCKAPSRSPANLPAFGQALRDFITHPGQTATDQQFADAEAACKALRKAEDALAQAEDGALAQISDVELMRRTVADLKRAGSIHPAGHREAGQRPRRTRAHREVMAARQAFDKHVAACQLDIKGVRPECAHAGIRRGHQGSGAACPASTTS